MSHALKAFSDHNHPVKIMFYAPTRFPKRIICQLKIFTRDIRVEIIFLLSIAFKIFLNFLLCHAFPLINIVLDNRAHCGNFIN